MASQDCKRACRGLLDHFFDLHPNAAMERRALKALRLLLASDASLTGASGGWAAGIIYAAANRDRRACGVPGILNSDFAAFFGVSMGTVRRRAAQIAGLLDW